MPVGQWQRQRLLPLLLPSFFLLLLPRFGLLGQKASTSTGGPLATQEALSVLLALACLLCQLGMLDGQGLADARPPLTDLGGVFLGAPARQQLDESRPQHAGSQLSLALASHLQTLGGDHGLHVRLAHPRQARGKEQYVLGQR